MSSLLNLFNSLAKTISDIKSHTSFASIAEDVVHDVTATVSVVTEVTTNPLGAVEDAVTASVQVVDTVTGATVTKSNSANATSNTESSTQ